ncbi:hypothetical protein CPC08DRAFT_821259 [Agrocybe pediades]|nr:hypothetical protein CPC08DRAFT_821259 [Agrocybe pediades]
MAAVQHYARLNYDIWSYISSFFTFEELWAMRFLNDVVLDVALDAAYDWVVVPTNHYDFEGFGQWFSSFYGPDVSHRVRTLHIHSLLSTRAFNWTPDSSATETTIPDEKALTFYYKILQQTSLGPAIKVKTGFPLQERALLSVLSRFSAVSKIFLELNQNSSGEEALLPRLAIKATARTLAYLCIDAPFNMVAHILPDSPLLPNLETLSMFLEWDNVLFPAFSLATSSYGSFRSRVLPCASFNNRPLLEFDLRTP